MFSVRAAGDEVDHATRMALQASNSAYKAQLKIDFEKPGNIQQKQDIIAEWVGLKDPE